MPYTSAAAGRRARPLINSARDQAQRGHALSADDHSHRRRDRALLLQRITDPSSEFGVLSATARTAAGITRHAAIGCQELAQQHSDGDPASREAGRGTRSVGRAAHRNRGVRTVCICLCIIIAEPSLPPQLSDHLHRAHLPVYLFRVSRAPWTLRNIQQTTSHSSPHDRDAWDNLPRDAELNLVMLHFGTHPAPLPPLRIPDVAALSVAVGLRTPGDPCDAQLRHTARTLRLSRAPGIRADVFARFVRPCVARVEIAVCIEDACADRDMRTFLA